MSRDAAEGGGALRPPHCVTAPYPLWHGSYPTRHNCTGAQETHHSQRIPPSIGLTPDRHPESTDAGDTHQHHPPHTTSFTIAFRHTPAYHLPHILQYPIKTSPETHKHIARKTHVTHTLHTPSHHNRITVIKCHAEEHTPLKYHLTDTMRPQTDVGLTLPQTPLEPLWTLLCSHTSHTLLPNTSGHMQRPSMQNFQSIANCE